MIAVSTILVLSFMTYVSALRISSEAGHLSNLMDHLAAESTDLLTLVLVTNTTIETFLQMPTLIGEKQYWLRLRNDSSNAWLEGGFGNQPIEGAALRVYLPQEVFATGSYIGGYGAARLECEINAGCPRIQLTSSSVVG
jgi:hypothetical protein